MPENTDDGRGGIANRREVLRSLGTATFGGVAATLFDAELVRGVEPEATDGAAVDWSQSNRSESTFPLSVASGGPTASGVILWTKIAADAYEKSAPVHLQVAEDGEFSNVVFRGRVEPGVVKPENNYVVKADLDGELPADRDLYYRFQYAGTTSQVGRCRTLPAPDASPDSVRLAVVTCQGYQDGFYPAYGYVADENVDFLVHLGDQIYEYAGDSDFEGRSIELPSGNDIAWGLEDFRHLWNTYRGDGFYQAALENHTLIPTWDDHEIVNNRYWDYENDRPWSADHPRNDDAEFMTQLVVDGIKAWWEYNPARVSYDRNADHLHDRFRMWRSVKFGDLLELPVTDERLFRSMPPGGDSAGQRQVGKPPNAPERDDGDRTMLGTEQREWFLDTLTATDATWKAWANEVALSQLWMPWFNDDDYVVRNYDSWDGYEHERKEILGRLDRRDVENFVTLTGDWHTYLVSHLATDFDQSEQRRALPASESLVGVEFMTPAVSSDTWSSDAVDRTGEESESGLLTNAEWRETVREENPHVEFFDAAHNGYSTIEFTPTDCTWTTYAVDKTVNSENAERTLMRKYRVPSGRVELNDVTPDS